MSSDAAAVYFPDRFTDALDMRGQTRGAAGVSSKSPDAPSGGEEAAIQPVLTVTPSPEISDELLMEQVREGAKEALVPLFRRHAHVVRSVACRILRNEAEADDLVQEVFLFIFRKAALFDASQATARSWIVQVTYHRAIDRRRYLTSRRYYSFQDIEASIQEPPDDRREIAYWERSLEGLWGRKAAAELRSLLSADQLRTIELHFFEGYTLEEIAERMGQSLINVRHHYYRGLEKLRKPAFARKLQPK
jgi:RNA polymerase sigma-70 factor, ECF subfamily